MRRHRLTAVAIFLGLAVFGEACSRDTAVRSSLQTSSQQPRQAPATAAAAPPVAPAAPLVSKQEDSSALPEQMLPEQMGHLAEYALDELTALRAGQSLGEWQKSHTLGKLELYAPGLSEQSNEGWCARIRVEGSIDADRKVRRDAYFYAPEPPTILALPVGAPDEFLDQCRLGFIWADVEDGDAARAERLADATRESLASSLGAGKPNARLSWWGVSSWRNTALWKDQGLSLATASGNFRAWPPSSGQGTATQVLVAATVSASTASKVRLEPPPRQTDAPEEYVEAFREIESRINDAISIAAVGGSAETNVRSVLALLSMASPHYPRDADLKFTLNAIDGWLAAAPKSPTTRRAAALFVGDQLLGRSGAGWAHDENPPIRQKLEAHGAEFEWVQLGASWLYTHSWLKQSLQIDPRSRVGDLAFITLMESGFETSETCSDQGGNGFRAVIAEGSRFLRRKSDSVLSRDIHLLMAEAFSDIVTLANGGGYHGDGAQYKPEAASSRARAIEEYRLAFATPIPSSAKSRETWRNAWRLMAGLTPSRTYFYCVYD